MPRRIRQKGGAPVIELFHAAEAGDLSRVQQLLQEGADIDIVQNGMTPLIVAIIKGHIPVANALMDAGANIKNSVGTNRVTPLMVASEYNYPDLVQRMLELGADPNANHIMNRQPIFFAAQNGHAEVVRLLLAAGASVEHGFFIAVIEGREEVVRVLLEAGASPNLLYNNTHSAVHIASDNGQASVVKLLLAHPAFELDVRTRRDSRIFKDPHVRELLHEYIKNHPTKNDESEYTYLMMHDEREIIGRIVNWSKTNPDVHKWLSFFKINGDDELLERFKRDMPKCMNTIRGAFIIDMINNKNNFVLILENKEGLLKGLAVFRYYVPNSIKIELLCGSDVPGIGSLLIQEIYNLAKNIKIENIILESLTEALPFYLKKGFECAGDGCLMEKEVLEGGGRRTRRTRRTRHTNIIQKPT